MNLIPRDQYIDILKNLPILCADIVLKNDAGEYLLIKRNNEPLRGQWWVIGGRVLKGETMEAAAIRKVKQETNLEIKNLIPIGYFELIKGTNPFGLTFDYHTVSVVFSAVISGQQKIMLDEQSLEYKFSKELPAGLDLKPFRELL